MYLQLLKVLAKEGDDLFSSVLFPAGLYEFTANPHVTQQLSFKWLRRLKSSVITTAYAITSI